MHFFPFHSIPIPAPALFRPRSLSLGPASSHGMSVANPTLLAGNKLRLLAIAIRSARARKNCQALLHQRGWGGVKRGRAVGGSWRQGGYVEWSSSISFVTWGKTVSIILSYTHAFFPDLWCGNRFEFSGGCLSRLGWVTKRLHWGFNICLEHKLTLVDIIREDYQDFNTNI